MRPDESSPRISSERPISDLKKSEHLPKQERSAAEDLSLVIEMEVDDDLITSSGLSKTNKQSPARDADSDLFVKPNNMGATNNNVDITARHTIDFVQNINHAVFTDNEIGQLQQSSDLAAAIATESIDLSLKEQGINQIQNLEKVVSGHLPSDDSNQHPISSDSDDKDFLLMHSPSTDMIMLSLNPSDPASTQEVSAPMTPIEENSILPSQDVISLDVDADSNMLMPVVEVSNDISANIESLTDDAMTLVRQSADTTKNADQPLRGEFTDVPTVSRPAPSSLADIRHSPPYLATAIRQIVGDGISVSPEYDHPNKLPFNLETWRSTQKNWFFESSIEHNRKTLSFRISPHAVRLLDQGGQVNCHFQLHRLPTYPLLTMLLNFENADGKIQDYIFCPFDFEDPNTLIFLDMLMQDFSIQVFLCNDEYIPYRDLQIQLPFEHNVEYLLDQARQWKLTLDPNLRNFHQAVSRYMRPDFVRLGQMSHNFSHDSFSDIKSPSLARLASGIISYWSEHEQFDYLISIKSFPIEYFRQIQKRVLMSCIEFGIYLPYHLMQLAIDLNLAPSVSDLLRRMLGSFAEVNLQLRQPNDLDPWDNLENWQKLLELCDQQDIEVDTKIEELAERAQRRCESHSENTEDIDADDMEIFEEFKDMHPRDLVDLLQDPEHRYDAAMAICDTGDINYVDHVAGVFQHITNREDAILFADAFTQFGEEAIPLLISWLHLPYAYHREAAMLALGTMGATQSIDAIIKRLRNGEEWETAAEALGRFGESALPALSQEIFNKHWLFRFRALKALRKINSPDAVALITQLSQDPNEVVKAEVAAILG
jgi:hypothetical protein